jgi:GNAT superfamily N-acetyltransferase
VRLTDVPIRSANQHDAAAIAALLADLGYPTAPEEVRRRLARLGDGDRVLIADGGLIALHLVPRIAEGGPLARITALVVGSAHRRSGLGRALLAAAEHVASEWGCTQLEVSTALRPERAAAHAFYRTAGFDDSSTHSARYWKRLPVG